MGAGNGALVLLKIGNGDPVSENFTTVGGLQTTRMMLNRQAMDASNIASGQWRQLLGQAGKTQLRIQGNGIFTGGAGETALRNVALTGEVRHFEFCFASGDKITLPCMITKYERQGEMRDAERFALTVESAGAAIYTEAGL